MSALPFAGFNPRPSAWGYNWTTPEPQPPKEPQKTQAANCRPISPEAPSMSDRQLAGMPAALLGTLKREKKPFTYTPGGVDLSEVLNQRLQKRLQRKKRYTDEQQMAPPKQVIVAPTYNTPLDMYSMENALEALEVQAELVAADKSLGSPSRSATLPRNHTFRFDDKEPPDSRGVTQSKAFRVLQIITDTEEDDAERSRPAHRDEMRFTGLRESSAIPSKFFHTLQKITGTEENEEPEQQQQPRHKKVDAVMRPNAMQQQQSGSPAPVSARPASFPPQQQPPHAQPLQQQPQNYSVPAAPTLKRPAAFLPIKTSSPGSGFRPVRPPGQQPNGPMISQQRRQVTAGSTDF